MKYWNEMNDKYGFGDGESVPEDAIACRIVYVKALNALLAKHQSGVRVVVYDRPGCHNFCLVLSVLKTYFDTLKPGEELNGDRVLEGQFYNVSDPEYDLAVEEAINEQLDNYVEVKVTILPEFDTWLQQK